MKNKIPSPVAPRHPLPALAGRGVVVSSLPPSRREGGWLDSVRPQAGRYSLLPLPAKRGEGRGEGPIYLIRLNPFQSVSIRG